MSAVSKENGKKKKRMRKKKKEIAVRVTTLIASKNKTNKNDTQSEIKVAKLCEILKKCINLNCSYHFKDYVQL